MNRIIFDLCIQPNVLLFSGVNLLFLHHLPTDDLLNESSQRSRYKFDPQTVQFVNLKKKLLVGLLCSMLLSLNL